MTRSFDQLWAETFRHAKMNSSYFRESLRGLGGTPALSQLPLLDKKTLAERNLDFLCVPRERIAEIVTTSGTTGEPLLWMLTDADVRRLARNEKLSFDCVGLTARDTVLIAVAMDRCFMAGLAYWLGLREIGCAVVRTGATSPLLVLEMIQRVQPTVIVGVPSFLRLVADKAREAGIDLKNSSVKKAVCIGEPIRDAAFVLNTSGKAIEESWGVKVYSTYGVTELANSLCECDVGAGGHLHDDQLHIEILDDAGRPMAEGEVGEVVATTFGVEAMPVIRYRTGDCAALFRGPCACGRTTPRLGPIVGRKNQKLKFKGASLYPSTLTAVLEQSVGVEAFVIIARKESELSDAIEVLVCGSASVATLREAFQARAKIAPQIRNVSREEIESLQMPPNARKRRTFVDLRGGSL
jgi:phenylacetate-CoA ligase